MKINPRKVFLIFGFVVFFLLFVAAVVFFFARDPIIKYYLEKRATEIFGTKVEIVSFSSTLSGRLEIRGATVYNPPGYRSEYAFKLERGVVDFNLYSLLKEDRIFFDEVVINGLMLHYETSGDTNNLSEINENIHRAMSRNDDDDSPDVEIRRFESKDNVVFVYQPLWKKTAAVPLKNIELTGIGAGKNLKMDDIVNYISDQILDVVFEVVRNRTLDVVSATFDTVGDIFEKTGEAIKNGCCTIGDFFVDLSDMTVSGIKSLFGSDPEEEKKEGPSAPEQPPPAAP